MSTESHLSTQRVEYEAYENGENVTVIYEVVADGREVSNPPRLRKGKRKSSFRW